MPAVSPCGLTVPPAPTSQVEEEKARRLLADALSSLLHGLPPASSFGDNVSDLARPVIAAVVSEERKLLQRSLRWLLDDGALGVVDEGARTATPPAASSGSSERSDAMPKDEVPKRAGHVEL